MAQRAPSSAGVGGCGAEASADACLAVIAADEAIAVAFLC
jgi:hypothetical protein